MATTRAAGVPFVGPPRPTRPASKEAWLASLNLGPDGGGPRDRLVGPSDHGPAVPAERRLGEVGRARFDPRDVGIARGALPAPQRLGLPEIPGIRACPGLLPRGRDAPAGAQRLGAPGAGRGHRPGPPRDAR